MIDRATVEQILDTADIVDVVSDFVSLKKRGANWVGLCPFHNDRTPSFYVSRAKGICKCFSCGQGGSAVNFIMEHEQMTYVEALKYLANKYHIEVKEREQTDEERAAQTEREAMLIINEWACQWMENQLWNTTEGQEVGLSYFRERGFSDATIKKFRLGYSPDNRMALYQAATQAGYNRELLLKLGLCKDDTRGGGFDFYRGRVMFPIFNVAGKVIAFGGRTLKKDDHAKYFNSPESVIYSKKESTMYGLYQAKRAIARQDKCFIVEGYADVISMHQAGFENVIASSGTALTEGHIHLLHRFTNNVTELFDGDAAGIHAALVGIDKLLAEGLNIKVLLLPDGEDPDSYARSHSSSEIKDYITANESDFITFKTRILLDGAEHDPIKRSAAITDVVKSISMIPDAVTRSIYAKEISNLFAVSEQMILREIQKHIARNKDEAFKQRQREQRRNAALEGTGAPITEDAVTRQEQPQQPTHSQDKDAANTYREERYVMHLLIKYGMCYLCDTEYAPGKTRPTSVLEYVSNELSLDNIEFSHATFKRIFTLSKELIPLFYQELSAAEKEIGNECEQLLHQEISQLDPVGMSPGKFEQEENSIRSKYDGIKMEKVNDFCQLFLEKRLCSDPNDEVRQMATQLVSDRHQLSKIYTQNTKIVTEFDRLSFLIPLAINTWKNAIIGIQIKELQARIKQGGITHDESQSLLKQLQELFRVRRELARRIGDRVVNPK